MYLIGYICKSRCIKRLGSATHYLFNYHIADSVEAIMHDDTIGYIFVDSFYRKVINRLISFAYYLNTYERSFLNKILFWSICWQ